MTATDHYSPGTRVRVHLPGDPQDGTFGRVHTADRSRTIDVDGLEL
ncbi:hypothetical protein [Mycolicibacterium hodleri]|nr:hypothetical protein [Mycolicibacterium hodleri]